jgi:hypothetical protein
MRGEWLAHSFTSSPVSVSRSETLSVELEEKGLQL